MEARVSAVDSNVNQRRALPVDSVLSRDRLNSCDAGNGKDSPFAVIWWVLMGLCLIFVPLFLYSWHTSRTAMRGTDAMGN